MLQSKMKSADRARVRAFHHTAFNEWRCFGFADGPPSAAYRRVSCCERG
jgi:hypothetical protein